MSTLTKTQRWTWLIASVVMLGAGLLLTFLLVLATQNSERMEPVFEWLLWGNVATATLLGIVIVIALVRLALRLRQRRFGSKLLLKLAGIFGLVGLLPGVLIYTVSYQFVSRSIETWFDVRVEGALEAGLNLGRNTLDNLKQDLANKTHVAADQLGSTHGSLPGLLELERLREQLGAHTVSLVSQSGLIEWSAGGTGSLPLVSERVPASLRQEARQKSVVAQVEDLDDETTSSSARIVALAWMPDRSFQLRAEGRYLMVTQRLAPEMVRNALDVQTAYSEYQQRALGREGLRRMYIGTLTLALILAVFGAFLLAATLGQQLARPLLLLAEGVEEVARGDLSPKAIFASQDELGGLTRAFAQMTQQLADARSLVDRSVQDLDSARAHLQAIMDNLTAGVIVFDAHGHIDTVNPGATRILRLPLSVYRGRPLSDVPELAEFANTLTQRFELYAHDPTPGERQQWQESYELQLPGNPEPLTLLVRGADLPPDERLIVFDDLTEMVSAQRTQAWSEVARRVAHEIKNPLTPIQLSAERLQMKLHDKLDEAGQSLLNRSADTIVTQVQALKTLINEFRDYARLPSAKLVPLDLNALVTDVLALYGQEVEQGTVQLHLQPDLPRVMGDPALLRQVTHNLVQNALDAVRDHPPADAPACVQLHTDVTLTEAGDVRAVRLVVRDNGPGFPENVIKRAFEPYITTKAKGTGLGLAVVKKIADEHGALVRIRNLGTAPSTPPGTGFSNAEPAPRGAQVSLSFSKLPSETTQAGRHYA